MKTTACECCGLSMCQFELESEPCYGAIRAIEHKERESKGYIATDFIHACEGHKRGGLYEEPDVE